MPLSFRHLREHNLLDQQRKLFDWKVLATCEHSSVSSSHSPRLSRVLALERAPGSTAALLVAYLPCWRSLEPAGSAAILDFLFRFSATLCLRVGRCIGCCLQAVKCLLRKVSTKTKSWKVWTSLTSLKEKSSRQPWSQPAHSLRSKAICIILIFWFSNSISSHFRVICVVISSFSLIKLSNCFFSLSMAASLSCKRQRETRQKSTFGRWSWWVRSPWGFLLAWCSRLESRGARIWCVEVR